MRRLIGLFAFTAVALGLFLLLSGPDDPGSGMRARVMHGAPFAYVGWVVGLCMGLGLAWFGRQDWTGLSARTSGWMRIQGRRAAFVGIVGALVGIVLYF